MTRSRRTCRLICALVTFAVALPLAALVEPESTAIRDKSFRHPDLYIGNRYVPAAELGSPRLAEDLAALGVPPGGAYMDVRGGRWGTLMLGHPIIPGTAPGNRLSWPESGPPADLAQLKQAAWDGFVAYLSSREDVLGIEVRELQEPGVVTVHRGGDLIQIYAPRVVAGVPVRDSYLTASIGRGNLVLFGATHWGDVGVPARPGLTADAAVAVVRGHLGGFAASTSFRKSTLAFVPFAAVADPAQVRLGDGYAYRLAWVTTAAIEGDLGTWESMVDAHTGELLKLEDMNNYASTRKVVGGVLPIANDGVPPDGIEQAGWPMPFADVMVGGDTLFTDSGGNLLACVDGTITSTLSGRFMSMSDNCGAISHSTATDVLDFGTSAGTDCTTPGVGGPGNTHASRSGFYEMNRIKEQARGHVPDNSWLDEQLTSIMNINNTCNAFWNGATVNFYRSGGGCGNTGEIAGVYDHEWGHGFDDNDAMPTISNPGEGIPDVHASLRLNTSCIGRSFRATNCSGYGDPCTGCTGVRDIDWANRNSGMPHDLSSPFPIGIDALCGAGGGAPCGGSSHCEGAAYSESIWDLWNRDLPCFGPGFDDTTGTCVGGAAPTFDVNTTRELATQLTYIGGGAVGNWFQCSAPFGGCNADSGYMNFLLADDDDMNPLNGTPHMSAIFDAFDRHQIACATPAVLDSGCPNTPTAQPVITSADPLDRGALLEWNAVTDAVSYNVYRAEGVHGCDFGKELVGSTTDLTFIDDNLMNGMDYYYIVIPVGPDSTCFGPASDCTTVTPAAGGNLALDPVTTGTTTILSGDGDVFLDNCEDAVMIVAVSNIGTGSQTNVRITSVTPVGNPSIQVTSALPLTVAGSQDPCETNLAKITFLAGGLALGDVVDFEIEYTSNELSPVVKTETVRAAVAGAESDLQFFATKTFTFETDFEDWAVQEGMYFRTGTGGGDGTTFFLDSTDGLNDQCDRIRSPVISLSAGSTMEMWNNWDIEPLSGGTWYDRANVGLVDGDGNRTLLTPDGGRLYNADSSGPGNYTGCNEPEEGWADDAPAFDTWGTSTWSTGQMGGPSGLVQLEVIYGTDALLSNRGFWFDQVTLTDVDLQVADAQSDSCVGPQLIFLGNFESGDTSTWSETVP